MNSGFNTDLLMKELWVNLARDFRVWTYPELGMNHESLIRKMDIAGFREKPFPDKFNAPIHIFKAQYQLEALFKRYRFNNDQFTAEQLKEITTKKFLEVQDRIATPVPNTPLINRVLDGARLLIEDVLGEFDQDELLACCRFGKKATKGNPLHVSYLDSKLGAKITGSTEQIRWFLDEYLPSDYLLMESLAKCSPTGEPRFEVCDTLNASLVPKSYKSLRLILPNTLIGSLRSKGLGVMIERRLRKFLGLDIKKLQRIHAKLVRDMSKNRLYVTTDLSGASDSPNLDLAKKVLPESWFKELDLGRITKVQLGDEVHEMNSFMTMGIGFTFPFETLLFYALLKSIAMATGIRGRISVYGDDLIYHRDLHKYVAVIFPQLHLLINKEKTYVSTYFRESCGADCYHGSDVRPFSPEGESQNLDRKAYTMLLYKTINGLKLRWDPLEIPGTIKFLLAEILLVDGVIFQVPPSFPALSGLHTSKITKDFGFAPVLRDPDINGFMFPYYRIVEGKRYVMQQIPYYWENLMLSTTTAQDLVEDPYNYAQIQNKKFYFGRKALKEFLHRCTDFTDTFLWIKQKPQPKSYRSTLTGKRMKKLVALVHHKTAQKIKRCSGSTSVWI